MGKHTHARGQKSALSKLMAGITHEKKARWQYGDHVIHLLSYDQDSLGRLAGVVKEIAKSLIYELNRRFPADDVAVLRHFSVFEVDSYAVLSHEKLAVGDKITSGRGGRKPEFGEISIRTLLKIYTTGEYPLFPSTKEDVDLLLREYCGMQNFLFHCAKDNKNSAQAWHDIKRLHAGDFPNMIKLYSVYRLYPTATAIVERGFQRTAF